MFGAQLLPAKDDEYVDDDFSAILRKYLPNLRVGAYPTSNILLRVLRATHRFSIYFPIESNCPLIINKKETKESNLWLLLFAYAPKINSGRAKRERESRRKYEIE